MRKLLVLGFVLVSCGSNLPGDGGPGENDFNLTFEVVNQGGALRLTWEQVEGASLYRIYADEQLVDSVADTVYILTVPCGLARVEAAPLSLWASVDIAGKVVASRVDGWGELDSPYKPALGFVDGVAQVYSQNDVANYGNFEVLLDDGQPGVQPYEIDLRAPTAYQPPYNSHANGFAHWPSGSITAPGPSSYDGVFPEAGGLQPGEYAMWINPEGLGWDTGDHFVKIVIESVESDGAVRATCYYQTIGGLRWIP